MDSDRLKDIQTADLSETQVNEDFVHWLKTKGPSYLLIIMIVIVSYLFSFGTNKVKLRIEQKHGLHILKQAQRDYLHRTKTLHNRIQILIRFKNSVC